MGRLVHGGSDYGVGKGDDDDNSRNLREGSRAT